jgi:hypothetical protein
VSPFLARLAARVTGSDPGLMPRPRYRFGDRVATAGSESNASIRMEESTGPPEFGGRSAARRRVSLSPTSPAVRMEPGRYGTRDENESGTAASVADMRVEPRVSERLLPLNPPVGEEVGGRGPPRGKSEAIADVQPSPISAEATHATVRTMAARLESDSTGVLQSRQVERTARHGGSQTISRAEETSAPVIVHIGRIDVRAVHSQAPTTSPASRKSSVRKPSLQTYLRDREGGRK